MKALVLLVLTGLFVGLGEVYGYGRSVVGLALSVTILYLGFSYFRSAGASLPDVEPTDARDRGLKYVCSICGLELKVEVATNERAPTHCRESMKLVRSGQDLHSV
jgi:divalent metal cation (Fe/Co/Zn/Cd) transporter